MVAYETYASALITKGHGHPLWEPDPGPNTSAVELGDVGYLCEGAFVKLFNVSKDIHDPSNRLGLPRGHTPFHIGDVRYRTPLLEAPEYISSEGVSGIGADVRITAGASGLEAAGGFSFECSQQQGALLIMRGVARRQDAADRERFSDYFIENHCSWLEFASSLGRGLSLSDLIFVDGCDKTSEWACAAWSEKTQSVRFSFVAGIPGIADGSVGLWGRWVSPQSLDKNVGPRPLPGDTALQSPSSDAISVNDSPSLEVDQPASPSTPQPCFNQCVFVRGYQMGDRSTFFKRKRTRIDVGNGFKYLPKPSKSKKKEKDDSATQHDTQQQLPSSTGGGSTSRPSLQLIGFESGHGLQNVEYFESDDEQSDDEPLTDIEMNTPVEAMMGYIFEESAAKFALIHYKDIIDLFQKTSNSNPSVRDYTIWIRQLAPPVHVNSDVGMFARTSNARMGSSGLRNRHQSLCDYTGSAQYTDVRYMPPASGIPPANARVPTSMAATGKNQHYSASLPAEAGAIARPLVTLSAGMRSGTNSLMSAGLTEQSEIVEGLSRSGVEPGGGAGSGSRTQDGVGTAVRAASQSIATAIPIFSFLVHQVFHRDPFLPATTPLPTLPHEILLDIIEIVHDQPTLATLSLVCRDFYKRCALRLWQHLHLCSFTGLASIILAIESKPPLARHIQSVAFMCGADDMKKYREHINAHMDCSPSCFYELPGNDIEKLRAVWEGREDVDVRKPGKEWRAAELLPQIFLRQLDAHGLPPDRRSYAFSFDVPWKWYDSFMNTMLAHPPSDPERDAHVMRCICFEGDTHGSLSPDIVESTALHLYGQPSDWTHHESPRNTPTFARFPGIKCIVFSIHTWYEDDDDDCNIFERCHEYDQYHSTGALEKVVVRMTPEVSGQVRKTFEKYNWPKRRDIVEFRLWDIVDMAPDEAVAHELRNGTWHDWLDQPGVLGRKLSLADLSHLANDILPSAGGRLPRDQ